MNQNKMQLEFDSRSCNESFARVAVAAFLTQLNPTLEEVADVKTAISEAVTNAIIHGYEGRVEKITINCRICGQKLEVEVIDYGKGIPNVPLAMEPLFTTKAECDRAGMGFAFMEAFMDSLEVESEPGKGTLVRMTKRIARECGQGPSGYGKKNASEREDPPGYGKKNASEGENPPGYGKKNVSEREDPSGYGKKNASEGEKSFGYEKCAAAEKNKIGER